MTVFFTREFIEDLKSAEDGRLVRRVLNQAFDADGEFRKGQNDHRYHGIENAWIRYVSQGKAGYRLIYLRIGESVYLYRAGVHSIEDELSSPKRLDLAIAVGEVRAVETVQNPGWAANWVDNGELLKTTQEVMLKKVIHSLAHVGHREIVLVSPFVSEETVSRQAPLGRLLDRAIEEGTQVWLVTRPPELAKLDFFRGLEEREIGVYFYKSLHAKLYLFDVNADTLSEYNKDISATGILGSANLTEMGLALTGELANEELCYRLPAAKYEEARQYAFWLMNHSDDVAAYRLRSTRRF